MFEFNKRKNILILGSNGMLGHDVYQFFRNASQERDSQVGTVIGLDIEDKIDLTSEDALDIYMDKSIYYDWCINCVAYTNTAAAENTDEGKIADYKLNALAPKYIAKACMKHRTKLIHISTDYVFSQNSAYTCASRGKFRCEDEPFPVNMYGRHKLLGEEFIRDEFTDWPEGYSILRTSWLYGAHNGKSFIHKFVNNAVKALKNGSKEIEMTANEVSIPTSTSTVVTCIVKAIAYGCKNIVHAVPRCDEDGVSRCEWAREILSLLGNIEIAGNKLSDLTVKEVNRNTYQPSFSAMESTYLADTIDWKSDLTSFLANHGAEIVEAACK